MRRLAVLGLMGVMVTACAPTYPLDQKIMLNGQYWQRIETADMIYQRGPKAQQMLMRDIARCTSELNELERMGMLRNAVPRDPDSLKTPSPDPDRGDYPKRNPAYEQALADWETPDRDGYLLNEPQEYEDLDGCMYAKGWERTKFVPYESAIRARENYLNALDQQKARTRAGERTRMPASDTAHAIEDQGNTGGNTLSDPENGGSLNP